jgi:tight adherence protein B
LTLELFLIWLVCFTSLGALALTYRLIFTPIPKTRIQKALSGANSSSLSAEDLPSIARTRTLISGRTSGALGRLLAKLQTWSDLASIAGWNISGSKIFLLFGLASLTFFFAFHFIVGIGIPLSGLGAALVPGLGMCVIAYTAMNRTLTKFKSLFPDALDLVVRGVRAGLPVSEAMKLIGSEVSAPVGPAFDGVSANIAIGMSLDEALADLAKRVPIPEVKFFVISLTIQQETGGNLSEILANLSALMRKRVQVKKKIRALSSEARASALIIGSLPFVVTVVIYFFNRSYIEVLFFESTGRFLLGCALMSIATGGAIMAKLIRFRV